MDNRDSYILKVSTVINDNTYTFICNRNSDNFKTLYNDKYIKWFEYVTVPNIMSLDDSNVEILEVLHGVDNYNRRHQKMIDPIKKEYISNLIDAKDDDEIITNVVINNKIKSIRQKIKDRYNTIRESIQTMTYDEIYEIIKKIWFNEKWMNALSKPRFMFMNNADGINEIGTVALIFRDYLLAQKAAGNKLPFSDKHTIRKTIRNEIKNILIR